MDGLRSAFGVGRGFDRGCLFGPCEIHVSCRVHVTEALKKLPAVFYRLAGGGEPVRDWLKALDQGDRRIVGHDVGRAEFGWPVGMPVCRALGGGLWEIRSHLTGGRIARVIFCVHGGQMVLLHGFEKKTQKAPRLDLELARKRQKDVEL